MVVNPFTSPTMICRIVNGKKNVISYMSEAREERWKETIDFFFVVDHKQQQRRLLDLKRNEIQEDFFFFEGVNDTILHLWEKFKKYFMMFYWEIIYTLVTRKTDDLNAFKTSSCSFSTRFHYFSWSMKKRSLKNHKIWNSFPVLKMLRFCERCRKKIIFMLDSLINTPTFV